MWLLAVGAAVLKSLLAVWLQSSVTAKRVHCRGSLGAGVNVLRLKNEKISIDFGGLVGRTFFF
jgi:hypothetical protein